MMFKSKRISILKTVLLALSLLFSSVPAMAERPRIGLVLGGGGARGFAHVGVLKVLEDNHIPIDCVIGTSIGSLVGGAYAAGRSPAEMEQRITKANWNDLLSSSLPRQNNTFRKKQDDSRSLLQLEVGLGDDGSLKLPSSAISTQKIEFFLRELTYAGTVSSFDQLAIPYRAIATDFETGEMVVQTSGDLVTAMRASMAVPGIFPAVPVKGRALVDGGLVRNLPVDVARETCADIVIAVDVASAPLRKMQISDIFAIADQYTRLMMIQNVKPQLESLTTKDVLITPDFGKLTSADFKSGDEFIAIGEIAALSILPKLKQLSISPDDYKTWQDAKNTRKLQPGRINAVRVELGSVVNPEVLTGALNIQTGKILDITGFHERLIEVYARGDHSQLDYELLHTNDGETVSLLPTEKNGAQII